MSNIGLDFGTTYSVVAVSKDNENGDCTPQAVMLRDEDTSPFYDSLVVRESDGTISYGRRARKNIALDGATPYKGFKLMLTEEDPIVLRSRGYDMNTTPDSIVRGYINDLLTMYKSRFGDIDRLVIGIPEVWDSKEKCRERLLDIVCELGVAEEVRLASEPTCAGAYYLEKYKEVNEGKIFEGHILIVDYGGGTLDIALCAAKVVNNKPKVIPIQCEGAGANEEGVIGKAGFSFMEEVVRLALLAKGVTEEDISSEKNKWSLYECIYSVEEAFKEFSTFSKNNDSLKYFKETFARSAQGDYHAIYDVKEVFTRISFSRAKNIDGEIMQAKGNYDVTYGMIARAYDCKIRNVLDEKLDKILRYMDEHKIAYGANADRFKVQLIGGFCNFYLVERQINQKLGRSVKGKREDRRYIGEFLSADDRTMAVAYGAALLANDQIYYGFTAGQSLSVRVKYHNRIADKWVLDEALAIKKGMEVVPNRVYLFKSRTNGNALPLQANDFKKIIVDDNIGREEILLVDKYKKLLKMDDEKTYFIGVSLDESKIVSFHWWEVLDSGQMSGRLQLLEDMIAGEEKIEWLGKEECARMTRVFKLGGDEPMVRTVDY